MKEDSSFIPDSFNSSRSFCFSTHQESDFRARRTKRVFVKEEKSQAAETKQDEVSNICQ
jgi:hypothetical protein